MDVAGETTIFYVKILNHPIDSQPFTDGWPSGSHGKKQLGPSMFWRGDLSVCFFAPPVPTTDLKYWLILRNQFWRPFTTGWEFTQMVVFGRDSAPQSTLKIFEHSGLGTVKFWNKFILQVSFPDTQLLKCVYLAGNSYLKKILKTMPNLFRV